MIEFNGELSDVCKNYMLKKEVKGAFFVSLIVAIIFSIPVIIATILKHWIFILGIPFLILIIILASIPPSEKAYSLIMPTRISIKNEIIKSESERFCYTKSILNIKKVVDIGECYHIYFNFLYKNPRFVCQKSLITKGTIEDFESLFEGKLERKPQNIIKSGRWLLRKVDLKNDNVKKNKVIKKDKESSKYLVINMLITAVSMILSATVYFILFLQGGI